MAGRRVHVVMDASLVDRIDSAKRSGESRGEFVRRAVERALGSESGARVGEVGFDVREPAPAEQPKPVSKPKTVEPQPSRAEMFRRATQR